MAVVNVKDFPMIKEKLKNGMKLGAIFGNVANLEGPDVGIDYKDETDEIKIATGWHVDENGDVVRD